MDLTLLDLTSHYFAILTLAFICAGLYLAHAAKTLGIPRVAVIDMVLASVIAGMVGSRLLHIVAEPLPSHPLPTPEVERLSQLDLDPELRPPLLEALHTGHVPAVWSFLVDMPPGTPRTRALDALQRDPHDVPAYLWYWARPAEIPAFWHGGLAYLGGVILAFFACFAVTLHHRVTPGDMADAAAPAIVIGLAVGRLGCFFSGCCYGQTCDPSWWSTPPPWYPPPLGGVHRYPTALLSSANAWLIVLTLLWLKPRRRFRWELFLAGLALYAPGRTLIESLRADPRGGAAGLSTSQLLSLAAGIPAALAWATLRLRARQQHTPPPNVTPVSN